MLTVYNPILSYFKISPENPDRETGITVINGKESHCAKGVRGEKLSIFIINPELYAGVILPVLIFFTRIGDVSMETIRVIYISRGIKYRAPIIAFFEIIIWLLTMEVVMKDLSNITNFLAFAPSGTVYYCVHTTSHTKAL